MNAHDNANKPCNVTALLRREHARAAEIAREQRERGGGTSAVAELESFAARAGAEQSERGGSE